MLEQMQLKEMTNSAKTDGIAMDLLNEGCKPYVSDSLAKELVERLYGLQVTSVKKMDSYCDNNFYVQVSTEHRNNHLQSVCTDGYVLKILNTRDSSTQGLLSGIQQAMIHLHKKGFIVPVPVPNMAGQLWSVETVPVKATTSYDIHEDQCAVQLLSYLPGKILHDVPLTPQVLYHWGQLLAKLQIALKDYHCSAIEARYTRWNQLNFLTTYDFLHAVEDTNNRLLAKSVLDSFRAVYPRLTDMPSVIIHGDFSENNLVLMEGSLPNGLTSSDVDTNTYGILDFGVMNFAPNVCDVGSSLAYSVIECRTMEPVLAIGHVLAGYLGIKKLSTNELSLLRLCAASRLCQSLVMGAFFYTLDPNNKYILCTSHRGWKVLKQLWTTPEEILYEQWKKIIASYDENLASNLDFKVI